MFFVFLCGVSEWEHGGVSRGWGRAKKGVDGAFPQESLQFVSCCDIRRSTLSALKHLSGLDFRLHLTQSPMFSTRSTHYPKCNRALRVKQQQAESPQPIISSLSGLAKQGDSFFFLFFFKPSCSSNSEGVGKPFLLKKGWKQKHKSANIKKQCQMNIVCVVVGVLFHTRNKFRDWNTEWRNTEWRTLINGSNEWWN